MVDSEFEQPMSARVEEVRLWLLFFRGPAPGCRSPLWIQLFCSFVFVIMESMLL